MKKPKGSRNLEFYSRHTEKEEVVPSCQEIKRTPVLLATLKGERYPVRGPILLVCGRGSSLALTFVKPQQTLLKTLK